MSGSRTVTLTHRSKQTHSVTEPTIQITFLSQPPHQHLPSFKLNANLYATFSQARQFYASAQGLSGNEMLQVSFSHHGNTLHEDSTVGQLAEHVGYHSSQFMNGMDCKVELSVDVHWQEAQAQSRGGWDVMEYDPDRMESDGERRGDDEEYSTSKRRRMTSPSREMIEAVSDDSDQFYSQEQTRNQQEVIPEAKQPRFGLLAPGMWCQVIEP